MCSRGAERRMKRLWQEEARLTTAMDFDAYGKPLETVTELKYLGRILMASGVDWMAVVEKILKAQN